MKARNTGGGKKLQREAEREQENKQRGVKLTDAERGRQTDREREKRSEGI